MNVLVVGATGATGKLLLDGLLQRGVHTRAIVRSAARLPSSIRNHPNLSLTEASLLDLDDTSLEAHVEGCRAVASCLGHNLSFKGMYGKPRRLVTDATDRLCNAIQSTAPDAPVRFVLVNTSGNRNRDLEERRSIPEHMVVGLLRALLPPHPDNEQAAEHLRVRIGRSDPFIEWVAVRPDGLIDENEVTPYELHPSPIRSPIFNAGKTSRINVADFMARLITENDLFGEWKGRMPVLYNAEV